MYGMYGPATDPGERKFTALVKAIDPDHIDIGQSPYRDYQVQEIAADLLKAPKDAIRLVIGSSLGANNCAVVAAYAPAVVIHGIFGFQASSYGSKQPIPSNVLFAHEFYNPLWIMTWGLGTQKWTLAPGNIRTSLVLTPEYALHPGETTKAMNTFLAEIKRIINLPGD
jgi:hypothetical protein